MKYEAWVKRNWGDVKDPLRDLFIMTVGLAGETGEVCELLKKDVRGRKGQSLDRRKLALELGDVLHYLTRIAVRHKLSLGMIQRANVAKLEYRRKYRKNPKVEVAMAGKIIFEGCK